MKVQWWEKTVEYQFAFKTAISRGEGFLAPLDGHHEQAGDALFADSKHRWLLIEFKRDLQQLDSEAKKFFDYGLAARELSPVDGHHFLIYGSLDSSRRLQLTSCTYFS